MIGWANICRAEDLHFANRLLARGDVCLLSLTAKKAGNLNICLFCEYFRLLGRIKHWARGRWHKVDKLDNVDTGQGGCGLDCLQWRRETGVEKCIFSASDKLQCACYINLFVISVFGGCCSVIAFELTPITLIVCWGSVCWLERGLLQNTSCLREMWEKRESLSNVLNMDLTLNHAA